MSLQAIQGLHGESYPPETLFDLGSCFSSRGSNGQTARFGVATLAWPMQNARHPKP